MISSHTDITPQEACGDLLTLCRLLSVVEDPRRDQAKRHPLMAVLVMALCAVAAGADGWEDIADTASLHFEWYSSVVECGSSPPSADTFRRVFQALKPEDVQAVLTGWLRHFGLSHRPNRHICFDGKALRGSKGVMTVNAFVAGESLSLAHEIVDAKENELTALPRLLEIIEVSDSVCTGDALYTQQTVAKRLKSLGADYILAVKANQKRLLNAIETEFSTRFPSIRTFSTVTKDRGWVEQRTISTSRAIKRIDPEFRWSGLQSVVKVDVIRARGEEHRRETRYFISSLPGDPERLGNLIR